MLVLSWYVMVGSGNSSIGSEYGNAAFFQTIKCLWTGYFVDIVSVDVENIRSVFNRFYHMFIPDFVEKCFCFQNCIFLVFLCFLPPAPFYLSLTPSPRGEGLNDSFSCSPSPHGIGEKSSPPWGVWGSLYF